MQLLSKVFSVKMVYRQLITIILSIYKNFSLQDVFILRRKPLSIYLGIYQKDYDGMRNFVTLKL